MSRQQLEWARVDAASHSTPQLLCSLPCTREWNGSDA